jgi:hypothetical protein
MMDFIKKFKRVFCGKANVTLGALVILVGLILSGSSAMSQTEIATASVTPTVTTTPTVSKKLPWPQKKRSQLIHNDKPGSMQEAAEAGRKETEKQEKAGTLKVLVYPQSEEELGKPLPPLTNFKITPLNGGAFLSWDKVPGAKYYHLYISEDGKRYRRQVSIPIKETSFTVGDLENGKLYYFAVAPVGKILENKRVIQTVVPFQSSKNVH